MVEKSRVGTGGSKVGRPLSLATKVKGYLFREDQLETLESSPTIYILLFMIFNYVE